MLGSVPYQRTKHLSDASQKASPNLGGDAAKSNWNCKT
jgi:hypothetical protein